MNVYEQDSQKETAPYGGIYDEYEQEANQLIQQFTEELNTQPNYETDGAVELQATSSGRVLGSGCTVALQLMTNDRWLGCAGPRCVGAPCPGVFFEGSDWQRCWGEVFKIYRKDGAGQMKVGDYVGLFYPRENVWFSMWGNFGHKLPCPGPPNTQFGFASRTNWGKCAGEALQIFAKGKRLGQTITDQDTIAFHYPHGRTYVQILPDRVGVSSCLIDKSGGRLPPSNDAFDQCKFSSVEITIYD